MSNSFAFYNITRISDYVEELQPSLLRSDRRTSPISFRTTQNGYLGDLYKEYTCRYDKKITRSGYFYNPDQDYNDPLPFEFYFEREQFEAYHNIQDNYLIFNCSYKISNDMLREIKALEGGKQNATNQYLKLSKYEFDLARIAEISEVRGAWISDLNQANISASSVYGHNVTSSDLYQDLVRSGKLSSITIRYPFEEKRYTIIISNNSSVSIMDKIESIHEKISVVHSVYTTLIQNI